MLAKRKDAHSRDWTGLEERGLGERSLLGLYDAGAVTAVAIQDSTCASGGRDGWLKLWRIPPDADVEDPRHPKDGETLVDAGRGEHPNVVTGVVIDAAGKCAWTSCLDGKIRAWSLTTRTDDGDGDDDTNNLDLIGEWSTGQEALCLSLDTESRVLYAGTADGKAFAFDAGPVAGDESTNGFECGRVLSAWVARVLREAAHLGCAGRQPGQHVNTHTVRTVCMPATGYSKAPRVVPSRLQRHMSLTSALGRMHPARAAPPHLWTEQSGARALDVCTAGRQLLLLGVHNYHELPPASAALTAGSAGFACVL